MLTFGPDISKKCESIPFPPKLTKDNKIITRGSQTTTVTVTPGTQRCGCCIHDQTRQTNNIERFSQFSMFHNFQGFHNFTTKYVSRCPELSGLPDCSAHKCKKKLPFPKEKVCLLVTYPFWCVSSCVKTVNTVSLVSHASPVSHACATKMLRLPA